ncbi:hypothetical protein [Xenorhabdus sp. KJ12.1]|uniref:hypothetical protein n=1 Tax=Xenorhabdus sp. KJ12.1 TaxID=1851571 RepID=UPI000C05E428|nr:hypothetical protein [Xenorhabdus sp. KJ12.1]PHM65382.1 hypothetical protein Xekj_04275 [Xenorhabdus sp. KJ12.1]
MYGDNNNKVDYLFDLSSGSSLSISGLYFLDSNYVNSGRFRNPTDGRCTIYSTDDTLIRWINPQKSSYGTVKDAYTLARLPFSTNTGKAVYRVSSELELTNVINVLSYYIIDCDVDIIISSSINLSSTCHFRYIDGSGVINIRGESKGTTIKSNLSIGVSMTFKNNSTKFIINNMKLSSPATGAYGVFSEINNSNVSFYACDIDSSGGKSGSFLAAMDFSIVNISDDCVLNGNFLHGKYPKTFYNDKTSILNKISGNGFDSI